MQTLEHEGLGQIIREKEMSNDDWAGEYKLALFNAFVWTQMVEEMVLQILQKKENKILEELRQDSFFNHIEKLSENLKSDLYEQLHLLRIKRDENIYRSDYMINLLYGYSDRYYFSVEAEIKKFRSITQLAGELFNELSNWEAKRKEN